MKIALRHEMRAIDYPSDEGGFKTVYQDEFRSLCRQSGLIYSGWRISQAADVARAYAHATLHNRREPSLKVRRSSGIS